MHGDVWCLIYPALLRGAFEGFTGAWLDKSQKISSAAVVLRFARLAARASQRGARAFTARIRSVAGNFVNHR